MTDRETETVRNAPPAEPKTSEADERLAAFKRGAPTPKAPEVKAAPRARRATATADAMPPSAADAGGARRDAPPRRTPRQRAPSAREDGRGRSTATDEPTAPSEPIERTERSAAGESAAPPRPRARGGQGQGSRSGDRTSASTGVARTSGEAAERDDIATTNADAAGDLSRGPSEDGTPSGAPRKRRRRGGRGRGRSSGGAGGANGGTARANDTRDVEDRGADDEADVHETSATQRDDATPDAPSGHGRGTGSRRRGSRGSGSDADAASTDTPNGDGAPRTRSAADKGRGGRAKTKAMTAEEQVAAGGPTRNIRNTRSRTGRSGAREGGRGRRREPLIVPPRFTDKLMVITERGERDQIAVLEENVLVQHYVTRTGATSMVGNVYLGRVQNVLPGMEAAFVDIGRGRNGVLYAGEVNYRPEDLEGPAPRIEQVLKAGQAVLVQVTKDPMGGKGARLTAQISLPGRFIVFAPSQSLSGISRRLGDDERKRLKSIMRKIKPDEHGVIVRTAAEGASEEALTHDLERLVRQWDEIQREAKRVKAPEVVYEEPELTVRVVRDLFTDEEYRELVTDSRRIYDKIMAYVGDIAPDLAPKIKYHDGKLPAFEEHRIEEQIHKALDRKVWLPSGGYLIIERTEAMTIVDVNTGKSVGKTNLEETVVNTNLEAAQEVARQLRLRDIGGIIVVDFIDMLLEKNKAQVESTMKEAMALDKTRSQVFEIGPLGLLQVTRKRVSSGLVESFSETCPTCEGRGILLSYGS
ncbi:MAG: Rne/Rng family ribonuclease [Actinomycetota bacterium]